MRLSAARIEFRRTRRTWHLGKYAARLWGGGLLESTFEAYKPAMIAQVHASIAFLSWLDRGVVHRRPSWRQRLRWRIREMLTRDQEVL